MGKPEEECKWQSCTNAASIAAASQYVCRQRLHYIMTHANVAAKRSGLQTGLWFLKKKMKENQGGGDVFLLQHNVREFQNNKEDNVSIKAFSPQTN